MLTKRIIPCLDVQDGRVVKGTQFVHLRDAGDPVELGQTYSNEGADELVFLDITASVQKRKILLDVVEKVAEHLSIPFTVGGGIRTPEDIQELLKRGADKVSVNTAAVQDPALISRAAHRFGSQCVVVAIDARRQKEGGGHWTVYIQGGKEETPLDALEWAQKVEHLGAGELLVTSMDRDGTKTGYDLELLQALSKETSLPVIASGGAGSIDDLYLALTTGQADAVLLASLLHDKELSLSEIKTTLKQKGIPLR